jgi:hypothetical protein
LVVWLPLILSACGGITITNTTWWGSLQEEGAAQFDTLDSNSAVLNMQQFLALWNNPVDPMIATHVSVFEKIQTDYQTICSDHPGECSEQAVSASRAASSRMTWLKAHAKAKYHYHGQ